MLLALLMVGAGTCADVDDFVASSPSADAAGFSNDQGPARPPSLCVAPTPDPLELHPIDVLILLDRSGSMDMAYGAGTRYQAVAAALSDAVATYSAHVRFGFQEMPGRQGCGDALAGACCASPPLVGFADGNAQTVADAIAAAQPMDGSTPTAASLRLALEYYKTHDDGIANSNRYVLLVTDDAPNCTLAGAFSNGESSDALSGACVEARDEVSALVSLGVRVIVLSAGIGLSDDASGDNVCLDALAHAGGVAASPGYPGFFTPNDLQHLHLAIERLFGGKVRPSCSVRFPAKVTSTLGMAVLLDGREIPRDQADGWQLDSQTLPQSVLITGAYCAQIRTFQVTKVEVRYQCDGGGTPT
jgi:hypothetical protein